MSNRNIDIFIKICNEKGLTRAFKEIITSNCIKDMTIYKLFYNIYFQLFTKRGKHNNFDDELQQCLQSINCKMINNKVVKVS